MLFNDEETKRLNALTAAAGRRWAAAELQWVQDIARATKPPAYDAHTANVVALYNGDSEPLLRAAAERRFKSRHDIMEPYPLNRMRQVASADSGVYTLQPHRTLVDANTGEALADTDERLQRFNTLVERMGFAGLAPEIERRTIAAQTLFVRPRWVKAIGKPGRIQLDLFWPRDVAVICDQSDPTDFDRAVILLARTAAGSGGAEWYTLWVREATHDDAGELTGFSPWRVHMVSSQGDYAIPPEDPRTLYVDGRGQPLPLPWTIVRLGVADGSVYVTPDRDLPKFLVSLNVDASAERLALDMQATTPVVYSGSEKKAGELAWGPGDITQIGEGEQLTTLPLNPLVDQMRASRTHAARELAASRDNNPNAYVVDVGPVESGVARAISQAPHEARVAENALVFVDWEQNQLWPAVMRTFDAFSGEPSFGAVAVKVATRRAPVIEDRETKVRRLQAEVDAGIISKAQMAVDLERFDSIEEAVKAGLSNDLVKTAATPPGLAAFGGGGFP